MPAVDAEPQPSETACNGQAGLAQSPRKVFPSKTAKAPAPSNLHQEEHAWLAGDASPRHERMRGGAGTPRRLRRLHARTARGQRDGARQPQQRWEEGSAGKRVSGVTEPGAWGFAKSVRVWALKWPRRDCKCCESKQIPCMIRQKNNCLNKSLQLCYVQESKLFKNWKRW